MKANKILVVALAGIILAVLMTGNASAATFSGCYYTADVGASAIKSNDASGPISLIRGDSVGWYNKWDNRNGYSEYACMGYSCQSNELTISSNSRITLNAYTDTGKILRSGPTQSNVGTYQITNINHQYYGSAPLLQAPSNPTISFTEI